jgi:transcriptional regulator CBF1
MAASVGLEQSDLPEIATTPGQKRKRAVESASPDTRRTKRGAPAAAMTVPDADAHAQAFLENTVSIAQAAQDHVNVDDFSALAQATAEHSDTVDSTTNASTAAAALNIYPQLHVPQTTEETFVAQAGVDSHHEDNSFNTSAVSQPDGLPMASSASLHSANGVSPDQRYGSGPNAKPAVGSEEWNKMRKDNHKEGELSTLPLPPLVVPGFALMQVQLSVAVARRLMKASTS